jgi:hypothetical protein
MTAITTLSISDGTVARVYTPTHKKGEVLNFRDMGTNSVPLTQSKLSLALQQATASKPFSRTTIKLVFPIEKTVDSEYEVAHFAEANVTLTVPAEMTEADRAEFRQIYTNMLGHSSIAKYVTLDEPMF